MSENIEQPLPRTFEEFNEQRKAAFIRVKDYKQAGNRLVGFLCSYTPLEIIDAAGAASVALCGTSDEVDSRGREGAAGKPVPAHQVDLRFCLLAKVPVYVL